MNPCRFSAEPDHRHARRDGRPTDAEGCFAEAKAQIADEATLKAIVDSGARRWTVPSFTHPDAHYEVTLVPGRSLTCSCPWGRRIGADPFAKPCRHVVSIVEQVA